MRTAFVTWVTPSFEHSEELRFCFHLLKKSIPGSVDIHVLKNEEGASPSVTDLLALPDLAVYDLVFVAPAPDFIAGPGSFDAMLDILQGNEHIWCLLPAGPGMLQELHLEGMQYYTLRGFERLSGFLRKNGPPQIEFSNDKPAAFLLIRVSAVLGIPPLTRVADIVKTMPASRVRMTSHAFYHSFAGYYSEERREIMQFLPPKIDSLLDIGCAGGAFGSIVKSALGCRVVGIELNRNEALKAKGLLDRVIEEDFLAADLGETFDCITCLDVIEHFGNLELFLEKINTALKKGGHLFLSIPNVGHWSVIADLMAGRWDYTPAGILAISHLRFFTKHTVLFFLEKAGLAVISIHGPRTALPGDIEEGFKILKNHMDIDFESLSSPGYFITARKPS